MRAYGPFLLEVVAWYNYRHDGIINRVFAFDKTYNPC